jgi:hypothetical protein
MVGTVKSMSFYGDRGVMDTSNTSITFNSVEIKWSMLKHGFLNVEQVLAADQ